jgi:hypothetical protein
VSFETAASEKPLTASLISKTGAATHTAAIDTTSFGGAGDSLAMSPGGAALSFVHHGPATRFRLRLSSAGKSGLAGFESPPTPIGPGARLELPRVKWSSLNRVTATVVTGGGARHKLKLGNTLHARRLVALKGLTIKPINHGARFTARSLVTRLLGGNQAALVFTVRRGRKVVRRHIVHLVRSGIAQPSWRFTTKRRGAYQLTVNAVGVTAVGLAQVARSSTRTRAFRVK